MLNVNINDEEPKHVERIEPQITVDDSGNVVWSPSLLDYDASVFYRGKTVTNKEFNELFLKQLYQGNYITDSLSKFLKDHLSTAIHRKFTNTYKLVKSYTKVFTSEDWKLGDDDYYYITIPVEEHGFQQVSEGDNKGMNIDTELYLLNTDGHFYEVDQIITEPDNTVLVYADDPNVTGFVIIRSNERAYSVTGSTINADDVEGLATVARTGLYSDLFGTPDIASLENKININASDITKIVKGDTPVYAAQHADNVTSSIGGQPLDVIFEIGSSVVKNATTAKNYIAGGGIDDKFKEVEQSIYTNTLLLQEDVRTVQTDISTINQRLDALGFKEGVIRSASGVTLTDSYVRKQGKIVYGYIGKATGVGTSGSAGTYRSIGYLTNEFYPKEYVYFLGEYVKTTSTGVDVRVSPYGEISMNTTLGQVQNVYFWWETN